MVKPRVIALTGRIAAGKTTVARILTESHGYTRVRFAGPLKAMLAALGVEQAYLDGDKKETPHPLLCHRTPRHAMQTLGTEWGRNCIGEDFWIRAWERAVAPYEYIVVDDARFPNECEAVHRLGGVVWTVHREGPAVQGMHASEGQVLPSDGIILNNWSMEDLREAVRHMVGQAPHRDPVVAGNPSLRRDSAIDQSWADAALNEQVPAAAPGEFDGYVGEFRPEGAGRILPAELDPADGA